MLEGDSIETYHAFLQPTEFFLSQRSFKCCYLKAVALREGNQKVLTLHLSGPSAEEFIQEFVVALKGGLIMTLLKNTVGIDPTVAQELTRWIVTKRMSTPKTKVPHTFYTSRWSRKIQDNALGKRRPHDEDRKDDKHQRVQASVGHRRVQVSVRLQLVRVNFCLVLRDIFFQNCFPGKPKLYEYELVMKGGGANRLSCAEGSCTSRS